MLHITAPFANHQELKKLKAGDIVRLSGEIITGRDAAHKRLSATLENMPVDIVNQCIYYVGPCPAKDGEVIGPCGPTTAGRVDIYTPDLLDRGLKGMIGKGIRSPEVVQSMIKNGAVYFAATGGAACLIQRCITKCEVLAYDDLGAEAIHRLTVKDLPLVVAIDSTGKSMYR